MTMSLPIWKQALGAVVGAGIGLSVYAAYGLVDGMLHAPATNVETASPFAEIARSVRAALITPEKPKIVLHKRGDAPRIVLHKREPASSLTASIVAAAAQPVVATTGIVFGAFGMVLALFHDAVSRRMRDEMPTDITA
jgi:hypothetical protein